MAEEARDGVRRELIDAHRKIREGEEARENARKENTDLKRQLKDEEREKEAVQQTANELRGKVSTWFGPRSSPKFYADNYMFKDNVCMYLF